MIHILKIDNYYKEINERFNVLLSQEFLNIGVKLNSSDINAIEVIK